MKRLLLSLCLILGLASPVWASEELGRQEDSPNADGQVLMPVGCVRQDTIASSTSADGDYTNIKCNSVGRAYMAATIDAALPTGANAIGTVGITSVIPGTGSTNLGKAEGATHIAADTGVFHLCVRHDTSTTGLGIDGTYAGCAVNSLGELYTQSNTELLAPSTLTDNMANPTITGIASYMMCFDGTTWDRCLPGLSDTDDNSVAFSQFTSLIIGQTHVSDGASWVRLRTYVEDVASAGAEQMTLAGTIRQDAPAGTTSADGDFQNLKTDSIGRLWINCGTGCSGGTQYIEDNASVGGETMTLAGVVREDAPAGSTSANGDYTYLKSDSIGRLWVNCGTGCSGGTQYVEDVASAGGETMTLTGAIRQDTIASTTSADGDFANLKVNNIGRLYTSATVDAALPTGGNTIGAVTITGTPPGTAVEDVAETGGQTGVEILSVRRDTPSTSVNTNGDMATFNTNSLGALYSQNIAGPAGGATPCYLTSAATTNSTSCKGSAGTLYTVSAVNTTATLYYLRLYNSAAAPTCSSATGFIETIPVPASTTGAGVVRDMSVGEAFGTGVGFCLTGGGSSTDNTNAATGVYLTLLYN